MYAAVVLVVGCVRVEVEDMDGEGKRILQRDLGFFVVWRWSSGTWEECLGRMTWALISRLTVTKLSTRSTRCGSAERESLWRWLRYGFVRPYLKVRSFDF